MFALFWGMRFLIPLLCSLLGALAAHSQRIHGIIIDKSTQEPIPGALVGMENQILTTNTLGEFSYVAIALPVTAQVQAAGYASKIKEIGQEGFITIPLEINELQLRDVLVTGTHLGATGSESPISVSIISPLALRRNDLISLPQAINQLPGVYVHQGTLGTNRITIRGIGTRDLFGTSKIRAYYADIPLTNGSGETSVEDIDLATIGRVEVLKGPNSSLFGAGLGGVINLLPNFPDANERSAQTSFQYGSFNTLRWMNRFELGQENGALSLIHSRVKSDGYRDNNSYFRESLTTLGSWRWGERTKLAAIGQFTYLKSFIPSSVGYTLYKTNPKAAATNWANAKGFEEYDDQKVGINLTHFTKGEWYLSASAYYTHRQNNEPRPRPLHVLKEQTSGIGMRFTTNYEAGQNRISFGTESYYDQIRWKTLETLFDTINSELILREGPLLSNQKGNRGFVNAFAEWKTNLTPALALTSGINANQSFYTIEDRYLANGDFSGDYQFQPIVSPRIGATYQLQSAALFGNVSHGFSTPTLQETLLPDGEVNASIGPEKGWNYETGIKGAIKKLMFETTCYWISIKDLLVSRRDANDQFIGINAGKTRNIGIEQSLSYALVDGRTRQLNLYSNATLQHFRFLRFVDEEADYSGNQLTGTPQILLNAGLDYRSENGPFTHINFRYTGESPITDDNTAKNGDYALLNLKTGFAKKLKFWDVEGYVGVQNLTNTRYASMISVNAQPIGGAEPRFYYPGLPRNFYTGFSLKFTL